MIQFRDRNTRGRTETGWLDSRHSFSFGDYRDPENMGFRTLRVINEDRVIPGGGFGTHGHRDMEIITYVISGALEHKDSLGTGSVIEPGDIQRMSAGTGITHSEFNQSKEKPVHFLQIWIIPDSNSLSPSYEQKRIPPDSSQNAFQLIGDRQGSDEAITIHQDAKLYLGHMDADHSLTHEVPKGRCSWLQLIRGIVTLNGTELREGDGAGISSEPILHLEATTNAEVLLFDLK